MKDNLRKDEPVYNKAERDEALKKMRAVSDRFYTGAIGTGNHPFVEFCGLLNEYITICERASAKGIDFTQANRHSGQALPIATHNASYLGEKLGCIYGPSFSNPEIFKAFVKALDLSFDVKITPKAESPFEEPSAEE